jgi:hypothetical protein
MPTGGPELDDTALADRTATAGGPVKVRPAASELPAGKQLGHFRIERQLGAGGMGEVYLATDLALDRPAAVKVLPDSIAHDPKRRDRLIREARAQARVAHPNVGHMYFVGETDDRLYFAMEYVAGETLAQRIEKGPLPVDDAIAVIRAVALGLREAQKQGITHRDIKPSNLMIDAHGVVKVLDFGLAAGNLEAAQEGPIAQTSLAGTPLYMAPEQARGEAVDFRTDIYALGATLFHLVSGKPPFEADSVEQLQSMHATAARPLLPRRGRPRVLIGTLDTLCRKMMSADPADRYASYDELLRALDLASDAHTKPGGFLTRTVAMIVDFALIRVVVALAQTAFELTGYTFSPMALFFPILALTYVLTVARWGRTPGHGVMELEVVDVTTLDKPRLAPVIRRALILFLPVILAQWLDMIRPYSVEAEAERDGLAIIVAGLPGLLIALWILVCMVSLAYASLRVAGKRAAWDRWSGTMVRYRTTRRTSVQ